MELPIEFQWKQRKDQDLKDQNQSLMAMKIKLQKNWKGSNHRDLQTNLKVIPQDMELRI